jgi:hypothetical protein
MGKFFDDIDTVIAIASDDSYSVTFDRNEGVMFRQEYVVEFLSDDTPCVAVISHDQTVYGHGGFKKILC